MNIISKYATVSMLLLLFLVIIFHILIIIKIIPYNITWGGRLKNDTEMYVFEALSIFINLLLMLILLMKSGFISFSFSLKAINIILVIFILLFTANTIGNLFAKTTLERFFTILTFISAILIGVILRYGK